MRGVTDTMTKAPEGTITKAPEGSSSVKRRAIWLIPIGLAVVVLIIVGVIFFSSDSSGVTDQQQLASVRRVCTEWAGSSASTLGSSSASAACSTMADWMGQQLQNEQMTGPMMWGSAASMESACSQWMETDSRASISTTASPGWCNDLVSWMEQHIVNWSDWMMNGNMMGGDSAGYGSGG
jgi:hypothetical protein